MVLIGALAGIATFVLFVWLIVSLIRRKKVRGIVLGMIICVVIASITLNVSDSDTTSSTSSKSGDNVKTATISSSDHEDEQVVEEEPVIEYKQYTVAQMMDDLEENALRASEKYDGEYVEITGTLATIDSDGKYVSVHRSDKDYSVIGVHCTIMNDDQKKAIMDLSSDSEVIVKGKITKVGEVLGYWLDIDEIYAK